MTKAELLEENDVLLELLGDIENEIGSELSVDLQARVSEFLEEEE